VEFKIPKKQVFLKLALATLITLVGVYLLSALFLVSNRVNYELVNTTWVSRGGGAISFISDTYGEYLDAEFDLFEFTYEQSRGYIICDQEDGRLFELIGLPEERLYAVNMNIMFYDLATLK
jgi:hypothetical protein